MNYLNITAEQLLQQFKDRLSSNPRFKNIGSSTIYGMFQEMLVSCMDMTNYYMQRTAEEAFIDTARLDSSIIKHGKNLGYNPRKPVPAQTEVIIRLKGPLPKSLEAGTVVVFNQETMKLNYAGNPFILDGNYSYTFTQEDIVNGASSDWTKDLYFSVPAEAATYIPLAGISYYNTNNTNPIKCFQGEKLTHIIYGSANTQKLGQSSQFYDIDDLTFSNWYGKRDPFTMFNNTYIPARGMCKVGIGPDEDTAMNPDNLYTIENVSVYLNEDVINLNGELPDTPLKVCLIDTNADKSTRITFSSEKNICDVGLKSTKDNIYIKYISTNGKAANATGIKGSQLSFSNKIYVHIKGNLLDVSSNIQFIINSDIYGGENFESQESIKINAPAYFSSREKYITKNDFISFFKGLTSPMTVQNALVFGQQEIEDFSGDLHHLLQNNIIYCLIGHLYLKNSGNYAIRNVLTELDNDTSDTFSIYGDDYLNHLCDYVKMLVSYNSFYNTQYNDDAQEQYLKNIKLIRDKCKYNTEINSILLSLPPYIHYYDLVGTVYVNPLTDINNYDTEIKNNIYKYLDENASKDRKINKSDIIKFYTDNDNTYAVDIDIKVSEIEKSDGINYTWSHDINNDFYLMQDESLDSYTNCEYTPKTSDFYNAYGHGWWNKLKISKLDNNGNPLSERLFNEKRVILTMYFYNANANGTEFYSDMVEDTPWEYNLTCNTIEDDNYIYLLPENIQSQYRKSDTAAAKAAYRYASDVNANYLTNNYANEDGLIKLVITCPTYNDYSSSTNFSINRAQEYKLTGNDVKSIQNTLNDWLNGLSSVTSANRAIDLPYRIKAMSTTTREETYLRRGNIISTPRYTLSEFSFWNYFVPSILHTYYNGKDGHPLIDANTNINSANWEAATKLIMDIYKILLPSISDSILDDNNNITNFSTDMEVAVLRNCVSIQYKS